MPTHSTFGGSIASGEPRVVDPHRMRLSTSRISPSTLRPNRRRSMMRCLLVAALCAAGCSFSPEFADCTVTCSAAAPECPDGFSCSVEEGMCRVEGAAGVSCRAVLDAGNGSPDVGSSNVDGGTPADAVTGPDAYFDPQCYEECDPYSNTGCNPDYFCYFTIFNGGLYPGCSSTVLLGSGTSGQPCPCAESHACLGNVCYQVCPMGSDACPSGKSCQVFGTLTWEPCGIGVCR